MATLFSYSLAAHAMAEGFYLGFMLGPVKTSAKSVRVQALQPPGTPPPLLVTTAVPNTGQQFGVRAYLGYLFSRCIGFELGGSYLSSIRYHTFDVATEVSPRVQIFAFDLVAKVVLPFYCFSIFGKIGPSVVFLSSSGINPRFIPADPALDRPARVSFSRSNVRFAPTASIGIAYDITPNWQVDISENYFYVGGIVNRINFFALGISYHFVDRYCGQFLCDD
jgi:opacity protein-like surface antigen